jgi:hypothetical protein
MSFTSFRRSHAALGGELARSFNLIAFEDNAREMNGLPPDWGARQNSSEAGSRGALHRRSHRYTVCDITDLYLAKLSLLPAG